MNEQKIVECLEKLNFSKLEAQIYITLLSEGDLSGYQLAKKINISRPSIYNALNHMYEKGVVLLLADNSSIYRAENPKTLLKRLSDDYIKNSEKVSFELMKIFEGKHEEQYLNLKGFDSIKYKAKELLLSAEERVYINTNINLDFLQYEIKILKERKVRIVIFSFPKVNMEENIGVEFYTHNREKKDEKENKRLMIVIDQKVTLIADSNKERKIWFGTLTNNPLMISIVSEHILNDVSLLKLKGKYGDELFDGIDFIFKCKDF